MGQSLNHADTFFFENLKQSQFICLKKKPYKIFLGGSISFFASNDLRAPFSCLLIQVIIKLEVKSEAEKKPPREALVFRRHRRRRRLIRPSSTVKTRL